ncbi:MAG TPA: hypothetical protein VEX38_10640 [Fimbriimonadaceae bacterium]|nr:hypothetical protein [Fimbriimonadaceae bacterium]
MVALSTQSSALHPPATLTIPQGAASWAVHVPTSNVGQAYVRAVEVSLNGTTKAALVTLLPLLLDFIRIHPSDVHGGGSTTCTVLLNAPVERDVAAFIRCGSAVVDVPSMVIIRAGSSSASFPVRTRPVTTPMYRQVSVTIYGKTYGTSIYIG